MQQRLAQSVASNFTLNFLKYRRRDFSQRINFYGKHSLEN